MLVRLRWEAFVSKHVVQTFCIALLGYSSMKVPLVPMSVVEGQACQVCNQRYLHVAMPMRG